MTIPVSIFAKVLTDTDQTKLESTFSLSVSTYLIYVEIKNNKARHNLINVKYHQMAFQSVDGAVVGSFLEPLGQTKVMRSRQRETTHEICCLAAE